MMNPANLAFYCVIGAAFLAPIVGGRFDLTSCAPLYAFMALSIILINLPPREDKQPFGPRTPERFALGAFLIVNVAALFTSVGLHASLLQLLAYTGFFFVFLLGVWSARNGKESTPALAIAVAGLILGFAAIAEFQLMRLEYLKLSGTEYRVFGSAYGLPGFFNPGFFAGFLAMSLPVTLGLYCGAKTARLGILMALAWSLQLSALLLTGARFGATAAFAAIVVFAVLLLVGRALSKAVLLRLAALATLSIAPIILFHGPMFSRVAATQAQGHSLTFRLYTWKATLGIIKDHFLLGTGPGTFQLVFPQYEIAGFTRLAHNSYLQFAAEAGIFALIAFLIAIAAVLYVALRRLRQPTTNNIPLFCGLIAAITGSLLRNVTDSDWFVPGIGIVFSLCLGLASGMSRQPADTERKAKGTPWILAALIFLAFTAWLDVAAYYADKGAAALEKGSVFSAEKEYQQAARIAPFSAQYHTKLAAAIASSPSSRFQFALNLVEKAIALEPTNPSHRMFAARLMSQWPDRQDNTLARYREAERLNPRSPVVKLHIADLLMKMERRTEALDVYRRITDIEGTPYERIRAIPELVEPAYAFAHFELGKEYEKQGKRELAIQEYKAAVERLERRKASSFALKLEEITGAGEDEKRIDEVLKQSRLRLSQLLSL